MASSSPQDASHTCVAHAWRSHTRYCVPVFNLSPLKLCQQGKAAAEAENVPHLTLKPCDVTGPLMSGLVGGPGRSGLVVQTRTSLGQLLPSMLEAVSCNTVKRRAGHVSYRLQQCRQGLWDSKARRGDWCPATQPPSSQPPSQCLLSSDSRCVCRHSFCWYLVINN